MMIVTHAFIWQNSVKRKIVLPLERRSVEETFCSANNNFASKFIMQTVELTGRFIRVLNIESVEFNRIQ